MSHTSRLPAWSVRYTTAGRLGLQQPARGVGGAAEHGVGGGGRSQARRGGWGAQPSTAWVEAGARADDARTNNCGVRQVHTQLTTMGARQAHTRATQACQHQTKQRVHTRAAHAPVVYISDA